MKEKIEQMLLQAKMSSYKMMGLSSKIKDALLVNMADLLRENKDYILEANEKDLHQAQQKQLKTSFIDRLRLDGKRIEQMALSLEEISRLDDPVGKVKSGWQRPNGIVIHKVSVPIGVVMIIYEARPNVTSDCVGLCLKSSNIALLRGGSDAFNSNNAIAQVLAQAGKRVGIDFPFFFFVQWQEREVVDILLKQDKYIDLVIPRGGEELIRKVSQSATMPVIKHYKGVCHIYIDEYADLDMALKICINAKVQRPSVCNAVETILVHEKISKNFLPKLGEEFKKLGVEIFADSLASKLIAGAYKATEEDWYAEYLDLKVALRVVKDIDQAIEHINCYGSHHTESIITENIHKAEQFVKQIDSACCFVNISTRFSDGYQFGLGAEIGISTDKLHARGPMGVEDLTTYKYIAYGNGQIRE